MAGPDIPGAKRAGLPVDLDRLAAEGDGWLKPEERYALKPWGVCAQEQDHVFMIRVRIPGGVLLADQARGLARLARAYGNDWVHLTTRQNAELHWVDDRKVPEVIDKVGRLGLTTRSACGHTLRNVMCSEEAGVSLDEPFDCLPDARGAGAGPAPARAPAAPAARPPPPPPAPPPRGGAARATSAHAPAKWWG